LQIFNKEADQIDAASSSHEAFLEFFDLGVRIETFSPLLLLFLVKRRLSAPFFMNAPF
jgi:hypothetical protein